MSVPYGQGELGKIVAKSIGFEYQLTWEDLLWSARMVLGEEGAAGAGVKGAAVLWAQAQRLVYFRDKGKKLSYLSVIRGQSQPISPKWLSDGAMCRPGGKFHGKDPCSENRLQRRERIQNMPWEEIDPGIRSLVVRWARGQVSNPVEKAVDFAVPRVAQNGVEAGAFDLVWDPKGRPLRNNEGKGSVFYSRKDNPKPSIKWPPLFVQIEFNGETSKAETPESVAQKEDSPTEETIPQPVVQTGGETKDRFQLLAQDRTEPNSDAKYNYYILSGTNDEDPHTANDPIDGGDKDSQVFTPFQAFNDQLIQLSNLSNLELNSGVPVIKIEVLGDSGELVNLNERIFGRSPFHNFFDPDNNFQGTVRNPERPLASIEGFTKNVQPPSVGGPLAIATANLSLKVHNPSIVTPDHDLGKYIDWMMRPGFSLRITWGVQGELNGETPPGFELSTEDFIIAQHEITMDTDLQMSINLTLTPAWHKLSSQINVGESIPVSSLDGVTKEDVDEIVQNVASNGTKEQKDVLKNSLNQVSKAVNDEKMHLNYLQAIGVDEKTFKHTMQGALKNADIIQKPDSYDEVVVENFIEGLQSIQAGLLTRAFERMFQKAAYRARNKTVEFIAMNMGAVFGELLFPEFDNLISLANNTALGDHQNDIGELRTKYKVIFGNFNDNAGTRAGQPISTFPVNMDDLLNHLRKQRRVGKFSDSINNVIGRIFSQAQNRAMFTSVAHLEMVKDSLITEGSLSGPFVAPDPELAAAASEAIEEGIQRQIERFEEPELKYSFYPNPDNEEEWIIYIYDNKQFSVKVQNALREVRKEDPLNTEQIRDICNQYDIPTMEIGSNTNLIKNLTLNTKADDQIMAHNLYEANSALTSRQMDNSTLMRGLTRNLLGQIQDFDPENIKAVKSSKLFLPPKIQLDTYQISKAINFAHLYLFFPLKMFSAIYTIYEIRQDVNKNGITTNLTLVVNLNERNVSPGDPED